MREYRVVLGAAIVLTAVALIAAVITARKVHRPATSIAVVKLGASALPAVSKPVIIRKGSPGFPMTYGVIPGDSLWKISAKMKIRGWERWHEANPWIKDPNRIYPGQELALPAPRNLSSPAGMRITIGTGSPAPIQAADNTATDLAGKDLTYELILRPWFMYGQLSGRDPLFGTDNNLEALAKAVQTVPRKLQRQSAKSVSPKLSHAGTVRRTDGVFLYRREMGAPFTRKRDAIRAIEIAPVDNAFLIDLLLASLGKEKQAYWVKPGQKIALLLFDNYRWVKNAQWVGDHEIEAEAWPPFIFNGHLITLIRGLKCYNLMIIIEPVPLPPPPVFSEPPGNLPPPPVFSEPPTALPPPPVFPEPPALLPPPPVFKDFTRPDDVDLSIGMFAEDYYPRHDGNKVAGYWFMATWYPLIMMDNRGNSHSFGVAGGGNWWRGVTGDDYRYTGLRRELDGAHRYRFFSSANAQDELITRAGIGQLKDEGSISPPGSDGKFESKQTTNLAVGYLSYEHNRDPKYKLFPKVRYTVSADIDIGGHRNDTWTDRLGTRTVDNPRPDKSLYVAGIDAQIIALDNNQNVVLAGGVKGIKYAENDRLGARIEAGFDFLKKAVELRLNHTWWRFDNPNQGPGKMSTADVGFGVAVNPSRFNLGIKKFLRNLFGKSSAEKNAKEVNSVYLPPAPMFTH